MLAEDKKVDAGLAIATILFGLAVAATAGILTISAVIQE